MEVNLKKGNRVYLLYILSMVIDHSKGLPPSLQIAHASCSNTDKLPGAWEGFFLDKILAHRHKII